MKTTADTTRRGAADWLVLVGRFASLLYLNALVWLSVWVLIPTLFLGWRPMAIDSGSMGPSIRVGDVVLIEPYRGQPIEPGRVVTFQAAGEPSRLVTHRVTALNDDGTYQTKGDANLDSDSTPLRPQEVRGVGRLVVPRVGIPVVWLTGGHYGPLAAWGLTVMFALILLAPPRPVRAPARRPDTAAPPTPAPPTPAPPRPAIVAALPAPPAPPALPAPAAPTAPPAPVWAATTLRLPAPTGWATVPAVRYRIRLPRPPARLELPSPPRWSVSMVPPPPGTAPVAPIPAPPRPAAVRRGTAMSSRDVPGWTPRLH